MTDRLTVDAHFHGHDRALLLAGYSFAEITLHTAINTQMSTRILWLVVLLRAIAPTPEFQVGAIAQFVNPLRWVR
ncbi:hypothetical protein [Vacuolonema iberomarrocanum]|uniref:hypothetical protein n=1 Tax=Vacuolonema iberomarrocanum TaxID=3454632 RepID=UPI0019E0765B|nr:hypothetical protein [filamentous cyanobacterium LEGE 07170]